MPAKDKYHDVVVRALQKDGWVIEAEQVLLIVEARMLWIDIRVRNVDQSPTMLVEVKTFENMPSPIEYLASAIGKYTLYRAILRQQGIAEALYLAVPISAFDGILSEKVGRAIIDDLKIKLIVYDPVVEEITRWIE